MDKEVGDLIDMKKEAELMLSNNKYMALATIDKNCNPWSNAIFYAYSDDIKTFYFISAVDSKHSENIKSNSHISGIIYDSNQPIGKTEEIKIEGKALPVWDKELKEVIKIYKERLKAKSDVKTDLDYDINDYANGAEFRFFKIEIENLYVNRNGRSVSVNLD